MVQISMAAMTFSLVIQLSSRRGQLKVGAGTHGCMNVTFTQDVKSSASRPKKLASASALASTASTSLTRPEVFSFV